MKMFIKQYVDIYDFLTKGYTLWILIFLSYAVKVLILAKVKHTYWFEVDFFKTEPKIESTKMYSSRKIVFIYSKRKQRWFVF